MAQVVVEEIMMPAKRDHRREIILQVLEDREDHQLAITDLEQDESTISLEDLERRLRLARRPTSEA